MIIFDFGSFPRGQCSAVNFCQGNIFFRRQFLARLKLRRHLDHPPIQQPHLQRHIAKVRWYRPKFPAGNFQRSTTERRTPKAPARLPQNHLAKLFAACSVAQRTVNNTPGRFFFIWIGV